MLAFIGAGLGEIVMIMLVLGAILFCLAVMIFWIWMLVDCIRNQRLSGNERLIWALTIFFLHTLGAIIYFFVARSGKRAAAAT